MDSKQNGEWRMANMLVPIPRAQCYEKRYNIWKFYYDNELMGPHAVED